MADKLTLDKHQMKDRTTAHLRIYVGGISDDTTIDDIYNHFIEFGEIDGVVINRIFGFVQFKLESSANEAINKANGSTLKGKKLTVRSVLKSGPRTVETPQSHNDHPATFADNSQTEENEDSYGNYGGDQTSDYREEEYDEGYNKQSWEPTPRGGPRGRARGRGRGRGLNPMFRERSPSRGGDWPERTYDRYPTNDYPRAVPVTERNDCEIIVVSKSLTEYAEYIEGRLKRLGIVVDLLFPMEDVPIGKVLGNIASRGCLYAILVMPLNLEHRSLTLTILHGLPQEHRNMPLEDALQLLSRNFQDVQRGGPSGREAVYALLGQLADGSSLTVMQYDKVIEYLQERREQQVKLELGEPIQASSNKKTQVDLQQRILSILNDKQTLNKTDSILDPVPLETKQENQNKLLNDPSVRKALDSILQKFV